MSTLRVCSRCDAPGCMSSFSLCGERYADFFSAFCVATFIDSAIRPLRAWRPCTCMRMCTCMHERMHVWRRLDSASTPDTYHAPSKKVVMLLLTY